MSHQYLFCSLPYKKSDIPLGSLIPDVRWPSQDACIAVHARKEDFKVRDDTGFDGDLGSQSSKSFSAQITRLLSFSRSVDSNSKLQFKTTKKGRLYELSSPRIYFKLVCAEPQARKWLEEGYDQNDKSVFITGYRTFIDGTVGQSREDKDKKGGEMKLSPDEALQATTGASAGQQLDFKLAGQKEKENKAQVSFQAEGERIYAFCYRKVLMSSHSASDAKLHSENIWRPYSDATKQRQAGKTPEAQKMLEATLQDSDLAEESMLQAFVADDGTQYFIADPAVHENT